MSNFDFIIGNEKAGNLGSFCEKAEYYARTQPEISITEARKANEFCIKMFFEAETGSSSYGLSTFDMINSPAFRNVFKDTDLPDLMHHVRKMGNKAAHGGSMTESEAIDVLSMLHRIVGEICYLLYIIDDYPAFDKSLVANNTPASLNDDAGICINSEYLQYLRMMQKFNNSQARKPRQYVNVHVKTAGAGKGVDSASNNRMAYDQICDYLRANIRECELFEDRNGQKITLVKNSNAITLAVKSGCSVLGKRSNQGEMVILPGIDVIIYSPVIEQKPDIESQFHVVAKDEFYSMWDSLGLIRAKVSSSRSEQIKNMEQDYSKKQFEQYADVISVQSFTNSGRKLPMVLKSVASFPALNDGGIQKIASMLR